MTATETSEYRELELASSNDLIRHDARRSDRKYPEAALHARNAGLARLRMGELMLAAGDAPEAAADWLSAAACFLLATDLKRMSDALGRAHALARNGSVPPERRDIHAAFKEREAERTALERRMQDFRQEYGRMCDAPGQEAIAWLLGRVRELPGFANFHAAVAHRATRLGQFALAGHHLDWAERFAPGHPDPKGLRVSLLLSKGEWQEGLRLGSELLHDHPEMAHVRLRLASALAFKPAASKLDWQQAIEILRPLGGRGGDWMDQLAPLALSAALHQGLAFDAEHLQLLQAFNRLAESMDDPAGKAIIAGLRRELPQVFPLPNAPLPAPVAKLRWTADRDFSTLHRAFERLMPLVGAAA